MRRLGRQVMCIVLLCMSGFRMRNLSQQETPTAQEGALALLSVVFTATVQDLNVIVACLRLGVVSSMCM